MSESFNPWPATPGSCSDEDWGKVRKAMDSIREFVEIENAKLLGTGCQLYGWIEVREEAPRMKDAICGMALAPAILPAGAVLRLWRERAQAAASFEDLKEQN